MFSNIFFFFHCNEISMRNNEKDFPVTFLSKKTKILLSLLQSSSKQRFFFLPEITGSVTMEPHLWDRETKLKKAGNYAIFFWLRGTALLVAHIAVFLNLTHGDDSENRWACHGFKPSWTWNTMLHLFLSSSSIPVEWEGESKWNYYIEIKKSLLIENKIKY